MKGFGIEIKNNLLDPKHIEQMGIAVWLYMWCIDKMTSIDEDGIGKVLGGKPIKYDDVKEDLGISLRTYRRWIEILQMNEYINVKTAPYGLILSVNKAHKRFGKRYATNGTPDDDRSDESGTPKGMPEVAHLQDKNGTPNKTDTVDNTVRHNSERQTPGELARKFFDGDREVCVPIAQKILEAGVPKDTVTRELRKFHDYWTEPTRNGKKVRWELQQTFDVPRRLTTWFLKVNNAPYAAQRRGIINAADFHENRQSI